MYYICKQYPFYLLFTRNKSINCINNFYTIKVQNLPFYLKIFLLDNNPYECSKKNKTSNHYSNKF